MVDPDEFLRKRGLLRYKADDHGEYESELGDEYDENQIKGSYEGENLMKRQSELR